MALFGKRVFTDITKALKMRASWNNQVGPKSNDTCPHKRQNKKKHTWRRPCEKTEAGIGVICRCKPKAT